MKTRLAWIALAAPLAAAPAGAVDITVGAGKTCDSNTLFGGLLLAALNGTGSDDILIANDQAYTGVELVVGFQNVRLIGGYATCDSATPTGTTTLDGTGGGSDYVVESDGDLGTRYTHHYENLVVTGGELGGILINDAIDYELVNVEIASNSGSGLTLVGPGPSGTVDVDSSIHHNVGATSGGGISCQSASLTLNGDVEHNDATTYGGGIYGSQCGLTITVDDDPVEIAYNTANLGAGLYLSVSYELIFSGNGYGPVDIHHNGSDTGIYGALFLGKHSSPNRPTLRVRNGWIRDNMALEVGGVGVDSGTFVMERTLAGDACHTAHRCSWLARNESLVASDSESLYHGGALNLDDATAEISSTVIEDNVGYLGALGWLEFLSNLTLENSTVSGHRGRELVYFDFDEAFTARHVSIAGNRTYDGSAETWVLGHAGDATVEIDSSIVTDPIRSSAAFDETYDCLLHGASPGSGFSATRSFAGDPSFVSVASGDLSLGVHSEAYDRCDDVNVSGIVDDLELASRPVDDPEVANTNGTYDLGAYEGLSPRSLFADDFEGEDTSAWSSAVG